MCKLISPLNKSLNNTLGQEPGNSVSQKKKKPPLIYGYLLQFFLILRICHFALILYLFLVCRGHRLHKGFYRMKIFSRPIDLSGVNTVVYHLPDGPALSLKIEGIEEYLDLELELGHVCDTSDIDGILHFFPKGNA